MVLTGTVPSQMESYPQRRIKAQFHQEQSRRDKPFCVHRAGADAGQKFPCQPSCSTRRFVLCLLAPLVRVAIGLEALVLPEYLTPVSSRYAFHQSLSRQYQIDNTGHGHYTCFCFSISFSVPCFNCHWSSPPSPVSFRASQTGCSRLV